MRKLVVVLGCAALVFAARAAFPPSDAAAALPADHPDSGVELIGRPAPAFAFERWIRTPPLSLASLRGKVVLVRWWTEGCHFCETTLPVIERLRTEHASEGLVVLGAFHPKPPRKVSDRHVLAIADRLGFAGPIAVDTRWKTLERYWLDGHPERSWTSISMLIDRNGRIRWVHGGGEYHPGSDPKHQRCDLEYRELEQALAQALREKPAAAMR